MKWLVVAAFALTFLALIAGWPFLALGLACGLLMGALTVEK